MAFGLTEAEDILKNDYLPPVREMLNNATVLLSRIEKQVQPVEGKNFTIPLHLSRNEAAGVGRPENGTLPTAGNQGYDVTLVPPKYIYGSIRLTGPVIATTKSDKGSFVRALTSEMQGLVRDTKKAVNRQLNGDGVDALAYVVSGAGSTSVVVDDGIGHIFSHLPAGVAVTVDSLDASSSYAVLNSAITITRGASNGTTGFAATTSANLHASAVDGDPIVVSGTVVAGVGQNMMGIAGIINSGNAVLTSSAFQSVDATAVLAWNAQVIGADATAVDLTFPLLQQGLSELAVNTDFSEQDVKFFFCNFPVRDKFVELCVNERTYFNTMKIDGGYEQVSYNGIPFLPDPQARRGTLFGVIPETLKIYRIQDFDWMDQDGAILDRVTGVDAYVATMFHYGNLGVDRRNGGIRFNGIRE